MLPFFALGLRLLFYLPITWGCHFGFYFAEHFIANGMFVTATTTPTETTIHWHTHEKTMQTLRDSRLRLFPCKSIYLNVSHYVFSKFSLIEMFWKWKWALTQTKRTWPVNEKDLTGFFNFEMSHHQYMKPLCIYCVEIICYAKTKTFFVCCCCCCWCI